jgi:hypothetical protein
MEFHDEFFAKETNEIRKALRHQGEKKTDVKICVHFHLKARSPLRKSRQASSK